MDEYTMKCKRDPETCGYPSCETCTVFLGYVAGIAATRATQMRMLVPVFECDNRCIDCERGESDDTVLFCAHREKMIRREWRCSIQVEHWCKSEVCSQYDDCVGCPHEVVQGDD